MKSKKTQTQTHLHKVQIINSTNVMDTCASLVPLGAIEEIALRYTVILTFLG